LSCDRAPVPFLERERVRCDDDVAALSKLRTIGLIWIAGEADDLTPAEIELPGMLMMRNYSRRLLTGISRKKEKRLYAFRFFHGILNGVANIRATIHRAQYCWVQRTVWRAWADQTRQGSLDS